MPLINRRNSNSTVGMEFQANVPQQTLGRERALTTKSTLLMRDSIFMTDTYIPAETVQIAPDSPLLGHSSAGDAGKSGNGLIAPNRKAALHMILSARIVQSSGLQTSALCSFLERVVFTNEFMRELHRAFAYMAPYRIVSRDAVSDHSRATTPD
ncbi:hypothetical protein CC78DRAFT_547451 [Lojkania enalia]|uniref:Uncharacterized protein n=1 Tax=Lojkania enalia TaxID=147567 RepID=A0A9P4K1R0_9PLEO|nr:hypothetical protein CC78DRAFT_547451 [Didymosphaeria enalia]